MDYNPEKKATNKETETETNVKEGGNDSSKNSKISLKRKIEILNSIKKAPLSQESLPEYFSYVSQKDLSVPVLKAILNCLIEIDSQLSATYEITQEDVWSAVTGLEIVPDDTFELKTKLDCFVLYFKSFNSHLSSLSPADSVDILSSIFLVKTKNIQFLIFSAAKSAPKEFFKYLLVHTKSDPSVYAPFLSSLLVRLRLDVPIKGRCLTTLYRHLLTIQPSFNPECLVLLQNFMYILCFKEFSNNSEMVATVKNWSIVFGSINKDVVSKFCEIHGVEEPVYKIIKNSALYFFPFDLPVIPKITEIIEKDYISFS